MVQVPSVSDLTKVETPNYANIVTDERACALKRWTEARMDVSCDWQVVSADASSRRYFRATPCAAPARADSRAQISRIAVDSPPASQHNDAFVAIAERAAEAGLNVPEVIAFDPVQGFLLLSDLGDRSYLDALQQTDAPDNLMNAAVDALVCWQNAMPANNLGVLDRAALLSELRLFGNWYVDRHLGHGLTNAQKVSLESAYSAILDRVERQQHVVVHRDYMSRNLMVSRPLPGIIDFQDARTGPIAYDIASLCRDAFIDWPAEYTDRWQYRYWCAARDAGLPVAENWLQFCDDMVWIGLQRHLKVLGVFARLYWRDDKPLYIADAARFIRYVRPVVDAHPELTPLQPFLRMPA